jgi:hypothetical protein
MPYLGDIGWNLNQLAAKRGRTWPIPRQQIDRRTRSVKDRSLGGMATSLSRIVAHFVADSLAHRMPHL